MDAIGVQSESASESVEVDSKTMEVIDRTPQEATELEFPTAVDNISPSSHTAQLRSCPHPLSESAIGDEGFNAVQENESNALDVDTEARHVDMNNELPASGDAAGLDGCNAPTPSVSLLRRLDDTDTQIANLQIRAGRLERKLRRKSGRAGGESVTGHTRERDHTGDEPVLMHTGQHGHTGGRSVPTHTGKHGHADEDNPSFSEICWEVGSTEMTAIMNGVNCEMVGFLLILSISAHFTVKNISEIFR